MAETAVAPTLMTAEEFMALPDGGARRELIAGEVAEMTAAGGRHALLSSRMLVALANWAAAHQLGTVAGADAGIRVERAPDTVRVPDVAYWSTNLSVEAAPVGFFADLPNLVVEVVSPHDTRPQVAAKAAMWLDVGVAVVWVVWPEERLVQVYRSIFEVSVVRSDGTLTCEDLLPGFALPLATLFG